MHAPEEPNDRHDTRKRKRKRQRLACPRCASPLRRLPRTTLLRVTLPGLPLARFSCVSEHCGWCGMRWRGFEARPRGLARWPGAVLRRAAPLALAGVGLAAAWWSLPPSPPPAVLVGSRLVMPGELFDGESLPAGHALLQPASLTLEKPDAAPAAHGLTLRRFCAWGQPGRLPYRGSAEQALRAAQLPEAVRTQIVAAIDAGREPERLEIGNDGIRGLGSGRSFDAKSFAMTYGRTLCLGTRVNFKPGHVEGASLYEAEDASGRRYSVMVPDICGNVSVLSRRPAGGGPMDTDPWHPGSPDPRFSSDSGSQVTRDLVEPGTLACSLVALLAALWASRRRRRGG